MQISTIKNVIIFKLNNILKYLGYEGTRDTREDVAKYEPNIEGRDYRRFKDRTRRAIMGWVLAKRVDLEAGGKNNRGSRSEEEKRVIDFTDRVFCPYEIELIDIDHDAGDYAKYGGDYIRLLDWLEETGRNYPIRLHSMNPVGVENMRRIIQKNGWKEVF
mgnify:CR=1 FL=1